MTESTVHLGSWKDRKGGVDFKRSRNQSKLILYQFYPKTLVIPFGTPRSEPTPNPLKLEAMDVDYAIANGGYGSSSEDFEHITTNSDNWVVISQNTRNPLSAQKDQHTLISSDYRTRRLEIEHLNNKLTVVECKTQEDQREVLKHYNNLNSGGTFAAITYNN